MWWGPQTFLNKQVKLHMVKSHWEMTHFSYFNLILLKPLVKELQWKMLGWISWLTVPVSSGWFKPSTDVTALPFDAEPWRKGCWKNQQPFWKSALFACLSESAGHSAIWSDNVAARIMSLGDVSLGRLATTGMKLPADAIAISVTALGCGSTIHFHLAHIPNRSPAGQVTS